MAKKDRIYMIVFFLIAAAYVVFELTRPAPVDWSESYSTDDKIPYGSFILGEELQQIFPGQEIHESIIPPFEYLRSEAQRSEEPANRIFINNDFTPGENEMRLLLDAVSEGDNLFISTSNPGEVLSDTLGFSVRFDAAFAADTAAFSDIGQQLVSLNFANPLLHSDEHWTYRESGSMYFSRIDTANTVGLGYTGDNQINFIKIPFGEGSIFVHLFPKAFTNYYLREVSQAEYAFRALSYLPVRRVVWDEYYKAGRSGYSTPMGFVLSVPSLRNAWFVTLTGILLFMVFKGRREQRPVPELNPPKNTTLDFARTIGSLYLEKGSHKEIAMKKITFFNEYCRRNLGLTLEESSGNLTTLLSERSGIAEKNISDLLAVIRSVQKQDDIQKMELKKLTSSIDNFYKNSLR